MASRTIQRNLAWVGSLEDQGVDTAAPPFNFIKKGKTWASECEPKVLGKGEELVNPYVKANEKKHPADCLYVVAKGRIAIGEYVKVAKNKMLCVEKLHLTFGSILFEAEAQMKIDGKTYVATVPQQAVWSSSAVLSKVIAYTYINQGPEDIKGTVKLNERANFAEGAVLLKIPSNSIPGFLSVDELKLHMYKDAFHKSRRYWLLAKGESTYSRGDKDKAHAAADRIKSLWKHCFINGLCVNEKAYVLSMDRMNAILEISGGVGRTNRQVGSTESIINGAMTILEKDHFKLDKIRRGELPSDLFEFYTYAYPEKGQGGKASPYKIELMSDDK